jgi:hypothetical protein
MFRIIPFILLFLILVVAVWFPRFRLAMGLTLVALLISMSVIIWQDTQERDLEWQRVALSEVKLSHMEVRPGLNSRSFVVNGRLQNDSPEFTLMSATLQVTLEDCHGIKGLECELIGQGQTDLLLEVPMGQARDFQTTVPFATVPKLQGEANWHYEILRVRAR